jgi:hypothetical protein
MENNYKYFTIIIIDIFAQLLAEPFIHKALILRELSEKFFLVTSSKISIISYKL